MALHQQLDELIDRMLPIVQHFHEKSMYAPHAATIDKSGELTGHALTSDGTNQLSVAQSIEHFESNFAQLATTGEIQAAGIFYHSSGIEISAGTVSLPPATDIDECRALVALLEHASGDSVYLVVPYIDHSSSIEYRQGKLIEKPSKVFVRR